jgi:hypothetical protein
MACKLNEAVGKGTVCRQSESPREATTQAEALSKAAGADAVIADLQVALGDLIDQRDAWLKEARRLAKIADQSARRAWWKPFARIAAPISSKARP